MNSTGRNYGLTDEEYQKALEEAKAPPDALEANHNYFTRDVVRDEPAGKDIVFRGLDVSGPPQRKPLTPTVAPESIEQPEAQPVPPVGKVLGLEDQDILAAMKSDQTNRMIDAISKAGNQAMSGLLNRKPSDLGNQIYNMEDKTRARYAAGRDFDLRTQGAEAKAANWERRANIGEEGIRLGDRKIAAANDRATASNEAMLEKAKELGYTQKEIADLKAQLAKSEGEKNRKNQYDIAQLKRKPKGGGGSIGPGLGDEIGLGEKEYMIPKPGYPALDKKGTPYKDLLKKAVATATVNGHIDEVQRLTQAVYASPGSSLTDGQKAALVAALNKTKTAITTATDQGVMNLTDEPRAEKMLGQNANILQQTIDHVNSYGNLDAAKAAAFNAALDETRNLFRQGLMSAGHGVNYQVLSRNAAPAEKKADGAAKPVPAGKVKVVTPTGEVKEVSARAAELLIKNKLVKAAP